jgi:hypothetical protein
MAARGVLHPGHQDAQAQLQSLIDITAGDLIRDVLATTAQFAVQVRTLDSITFDSRFGSLWTCQDLKIILAGKFRFLSVHFFLS